MNIGSDPASLLLLAIVSHKDELCDAPFPHLSAFVLTRGFFPTDAHDALSDHCAHFNHFDVMNVTIEPVQFFSTSCSKPYLGLVKKLYF